jgi:hypothetical protein
MPSPFPGMDPFLEHPTIFPGLHDGLVAYLREALQARLPEPYYAEIGNRAWVEVSARTIGPDVEVLHRRGPSGEESSPGGRVAVAPPPRSEPVLVTVPHDEQREPFLQILSSMEGETIITIVEVLSLTNKTPGERGRELYLRKQREVLDSSINLVEIDLLRAGLHTTAVPKDRAVARAGSFDYHVSIHRGDNIEDYFVYPIQLDQPLPEIAIPLKPGDPTVPVDLQAVFDRSYETGPYKRRVRYLDTSPVPPLDVERSKWASELIRRAP